MIGYYQSDLIPLYLKFVSLKNPDSEMYRDK